MFFPNFSRPSKIESDFMGISEFLRNEYIVSENMTNFALKIETVYLASWQKPTSRFRVFSLRILIVPK